MSNIEVFQGSIIRLGALLALCLGAAACASEGSEESASDQEGETVAVGESRIIATVDVGYGEISFIEATDPVGSKTISMSESSPSTYTTTPLDAMGHPAHTHLEIFQAIAPHIAAPQELIAAHPQEARALRREDVSLNPAQFDKDMPVEKSEANCKEYVYKAVPATPDGCWTYAWIHKTTKAKSGDATLYLNNSSDYSTTGNVTLGICNESDSEIQAVVQADRVGDSASWANVSPLSAGKGSRKRWWDKTYTTTIPCDQDLCFDEYPVKYRIRAEASSNQSYYLAAAEREDTFHGECVH